jgi:stearoyl-CoA desaturase (delta-9 desaturase)
MSKFWERFFYLFAYITQGSSYLSPRAYAILHRMHHAYTDTEKIRIRLNIFPIYLL